MPFWSRNCSYNLLLVRERLSLSPGLFLNVATTVFSVCNLSRNRYHLTRALSKEKGLFQEFPVFTDISFPRSLSAQGHLWLLGAGLVTCQSRSHGWEQHLLEHRLNHSGSGKRRHSKTRSRKSKGLRWDQEGEFPQHQPERSQRGRAAWTSLPPWRECASCS